MSLQTLAQQQKAAILARERITSTKVTNSYQTMWRRLQQRLAALFAQMQAADDAGQAVDMAWLYSFQRLDSLLLAARGDFSQFIDEARLLLRSEVGQAGAWGERDAHLLLEDALGHVGARFGRPQAEALEVLIGRGASSDRIALLLNRLPPQGLDLLRRRLIAGVALGEGPRQIARDIQQALAIPLNQALRISRTETMQAYRNGTSSIYQANSDVVSGWTWLAASGACPVCTALNGTKHDLSEVMEGPHPQCRCTQQPITKSFADLGFIGLDDAA